MKWFSADSHYGHKNICLSTSTWIDKGTHCRDFPSLEDMNKTIVDVYNKYIQPNDGFYFLGDWSFGGINNILIFREQINCNNIYFIPGNHDEHIKKNKILQNGQKAQELFIILPELCEITVGKNNLILSHYPLVSWNNCEKGSIHLHGHTHGTINNEVLNLNFRRMDIGLDSYEFRPYSFDEIHDKMMLRKYKERYDNV